MRASRRSSGGHGGSVAEELPRAWLCRLEVIERRGRPIGNQAVLAVIDVKRHEAKPAGGGHARGHHSGLHGRVSRSGKKRIISGSPSRVRAQSKPHASVDEVLGDYKHQAFFMLKHSAHFERL